MIKYNSDTKRAVIEKDESGIEIAVLKTEENLRITSFYVDLLRETVRAVLHRGIITNGVFTITHIEPIIVDISNKTEEIKHVLGKNGIEQTILPQSMAFSELVTPGQGQKRWTGDFRLKDVEQIIIKYGLLQEAIMSIEEQQ